MFAVTARTITRTFYGDTTPTVMTVWDVTGPDGQVVDSRNERRDADESARYAEWMTDLLAKSGR